MKEQLSSDLGSCYPQKDQVSVLFFIIKLFFLLNVWRCGGLMVSALDSGLSGLGSSPGCSHCVVFLIRQDTLLSQCFSSPRCTNGYQQICWG